MAPVVIYRYNNQELFQILEDLLKEAKKTNILLEHMVEQLDEIRPPK
jgi:hypothetical protein